MKWVNGNIQDEYRVDEVERGFPEQPEVHAPIIGYLVLVVFIGLCVLDLAA